MVYDNRIPVQPGMIDLDDLQARLKCSRRHIYRLLEDGLIPKPVKLGALVRWHSETIDSWMKQGCPPVANKVVRQEGHPHGSA